MSKILVGIPHTGLFHYQVVHSLLSLRATTSIEYRLIGHSLIYAAREDLANYAIDAGFDYLFFMDSDMIIEPDLLTKLIEHNVDIVSAMAFKRTPPHEPCFFKYCGENGSEFYEDYVDQPKGLLPVEGVGMACTLIKVDALKKVAEPRFYPMPNLGEDLAFCYRARQAGIDIYVDTNLCAGHITTTPVTEFHYLYHRNQVTKNE